MQQQLVDYLERNILFADSQLGFRNLGRSTVTAISSLAEDIHNAFDDKYSVDLILCDLSKACDCASHEKLIR